VAELLSSLPDDKAARLSNRLDDPRGGTAALYEAAAVSALIGAGLAVEVEPTVNGLTPDLICPRTEPPLIGEVWSRNVPATTASGVRGWKVLEDRLLNIPAPWVVAVVGLPGERLVPPSSRECRTIERELRRWLLRLSIAPGAQRTVCNYTFRVIEGAPGLRTQLLNPSGGGGLTSTATIVAAVNEKVRRYADTAFESGAALMVILGGDSRSALSLSLVRSVLQGSNSVSITFSPFGSGLIGDFETKLRDNEDPPRFNEALSAVAHVDMTDERPSLTIFPASNAARPLPLLEGNDLHIHTAF
jgi:hypothetical protein